MRPQIGYTNASWTLKADLVSEFVCRVINFMDAGGYDHVEPKYPDSSVDEQPLMDFTPRLRVAGAGPPAQSRLTSAVAAQAELPVGSRNTLRRSGFSQRR